MAARSVSSGPGSRQSPTAGRSGMPVKATTLVRSGSMNLPRPADSGVPAVHPDMCIVRIRRNHLLEVRPLAHSHTGGLLDQPSAAVMSFAVSLVLLCWTICWHCAKPFESIPSQQSSQADVDASRSLCHAAGLPFASSVDGNLAVASSTH